MKRVICLYGIDQNGIPVLMFFKRKRDLREFVALVPGSYDTLSLRGLRYRDINLGAYDFPGTVCEKRRKRLYSDR